MGTLLPVSDDKRSFLAHSRKTADACHMIFDSACHEGNCGMVGILAGARREEQAAKK